MTDFRESFGQLKDLLERSQTVLIAGHTNPEGDALGSSLALGLALEQMGKSVSVYNADPVPGILRFLPGANRVISKIPDRPVDLLFAVDMGDFNMAGSALVQGKLWSTLINVDHHVTNTRFGDLNIIDAQASSTGEVIYEILKFLCHKIDRSIATNIYTTLITDTGSFRYSNTTEKCFLIAAEMLSQGIDPKEIADQLYETFPKEKNDLLVRVLSTLELECDGKYAHMTLFQRDLKECGIGEEWAEGFINYARGIAGVEVSVIFKEMAERAFKMSMRSRGKVSVAEICREFGGGGHHAAAGCRMEGSLESVRKQISSAVRRSLVLK